MKRIALILGVLAIITTAILGEGQAHGQRSSGLLLPASPEMLQQAEEILGYQISPEQLDLVVGDSMDAPEIKAIDGKILVTGDYKYRVCRSGYFCASGDTKAEAREKSMDRCLRHGNGRLGCWAHRDTDLYRDDSEERLDSRIKKLEREIESYRSGSAGSGFEGGNSNSGGKHYGSPNWSAGGPL